MAGGASIAIPLILGLFCFHLTQPTSLNCTTDKRICRAACNEYNTLQFSATFCDPATGNCVCDCRDTLSKKCTFTPFTPCYTYCVNRNPNPDAYLYVGGLCPVVLNHRNRSLTISQQCACKCSLRNVIF